MCLQRLFLTHHTTSYRNHPIEKDATHPMILHIPLALCQGLGCCLGNTCFLLCKVWPDHQRTPSNTEFFGDQVTPCRGGNRHFLNSNQNLDTMQPPWQDDIHEQVSWSPSTGSPHQCSHRFSWMFSFEELPIHEGCTETVGKEVCGKKGLFEITALTYTDTQTHRDTHTNTTHTHTYTHTQQTCSCTHALTQKACPLRKNFSRTLHVNLLMDLHTHRRCGGQ